MEKLGSDGLFIIIIAIVMIGSTWRTETDLAAVAPGIVIHQDDEPGRVTLDKT